MIENDIPHIDNEKLKNEIEETEKFNYYLEIIYYYVFLILVLVKVPYYQYCQWV